MEKNNNYVPNPIDTSDIDLGEDLEKLAELIAENVHEVWAKTRMEQGWRYGETRDDANKLHPCIIPYSQLSESEKVFDRETSQETLKLIKKLGFSICKHDK